MRLEARGQQTTLRQHPGLQLDADQRVRGDVVALGAVSVLVHGPVGPVDEAGVGVTESVGLEVLIVLRTGVLHLVAVAVSGEALQGGREEGVEVAGVHHRHSDRVELHSPLTLVELEVLQQELLADVPEPGVVSLQSGTLQPRLPELEVGLTVPVTDGALEVLVGDAGGGAGDRQGPDGVTGEDVLLAAVPHLSLSPVLGTLVPDVELAVLPELLAAEPPVVLPLLVRLEVLGVDTAVAILSTETITETVPPPPVQF